MKAIIKIVIFTCFFFAHQQGVNAQSYNLGETIPPKYELLHLNGSHTRRDISQTVHQNILIRNIPERLIEEPCLYRVERYSYAGTQMSEKALQAFLENNDHELYLKGNQIAHEIDRSRPTLGVRNFKNSEGIYNPFSLLNAFRDKEFKEYKKNPDNNYSYNEYSYGENSVRYAYQFDKLMNYFLEYTEAEDGSYTYTRVKVNFEAED